MNKSIKKYYENEVSLKTTPSFPFKKKKTIKPWENILLAAITIAAMVIVYMPGAYSNPLRTLSISKSVEDKIDSNISRVIKSLDTYYTDKRSLYE